MKKFIHNVLYSILILLIILLSYSLFIGMMIWVYIDWYGSCWLFTGIKIIMAPIAGALPIAIFISWHDLKS